MTYSRAKVQGQRSVGSKGREYTNGQMGGGMEVIALPALLCWLVMMEVDGIRRYAVISECADQRRLSILNL